VVGQSGCGKSTAIAKGLKAYCLSEPALVTDGPRSDNAFRCECRQASFRSISCCSPHIDTVREGKIVHDSSADCTLRVLEVGTSALQFEKFNADGDAWPEGVPLFDGVVICYDVSRVSSVAHVEDLVSELYPAFSCLLYILIMLAP